MENKGLKESLNYFAQTAPAVWCGVLVFILTIVMEAVLYSKGILFPGGNKKIEKAKRAGHVVKGQLVRFRYKQRTEGNTTLNRLYVGRYEYSVDGKTYETAVAFNGNEPPRVVNLYYLSNPKKAFAEHEVGGNPFKILMYIFPLVAAITVMYIMGYRG